MIDGEAVVQRIDGRSDFRALMTKRGGAEASLVAFDLLRLDGEHLRLRPIDARREALQRLVGDVNAIVFSEALAAEGAMVLVKVRAGPLGGIATKPAGSPFGPLFLGSIYPVENELIRL
jgi:ATP-dependent DNA ligase